jgi:hypothetical protein
MKNEFGDNIDDSMQDGNQDKNSQQQIKISAMFDEDKEETEQDRIIKQNFERNESKQKEV